MTRPRPTAEAALKGMIRARLALPAFVARPRGPLHIVPTDGVRGAPVFTPTGKLRDPWRPACGVRGAAWRHAQPVDDAPLCLRCAARLTRAGVDLTDHDANARQLAHYIDTAPDLTALARAVLPIAQCVGHTARLARQYAARKRALALPRRPTVETDHA